jgi:hypothetical protein
LEIIRLPEVPALKERLCTEGALVKEIQAKATVPNNATHIKHVRSITEVFCFLVFLRGGDGGVRDQEKRFRKGKGRFLGHR